MILLTVAALLIANPAATCAPTTTPVPGIPMWQDIEPGEQCRVTASTPIPGTNPPLVFQRQAYTPSGGIGAALIQRAPDGTTTPLAGYGGTGAVIDQPGIVETTAGPLLILPMTATVSAHPTNDAVFRIWHGRWTPVDTDAWHRAIRPPKGTIQRNGTAWDWPTLRAFNAFWHRTDPTCCATGGTAIARLRLIGTRLHLVHRRVSRGELPFP